MSDVILTFQVQLSAVMETVLKSAMYEITRLVEDSFLEEVARSKQEVETLRQRLQRSESRHRERESSGRTRCADCGRVGVSSEETEVRPSGTQTGAEGAPPLPLNKGSEAEWSPAVRQDTAPSSGSLLPEQQSSRQGGAEACSPYESEWGQEGLSVGGPQHCSGRHKDPSSQRVTWTSFKPGGGDTEADGLDPTYAAVPEPASPPAQTEPQPRLPGLSVKWEEGMVKEEAEPLAVCSEEVRWDAALGEPWDSGALQVDPDPPLRSPTLHLPPQQQQKRLRQSQSLNSAQNAADRPADLCDMAGATSYHRAFTQSKTTQMHHRVPMVERPFSCTRCGKSFSRLPYLKEHLKIHTGEKPFSCIQCGRGFTKLSNLKAHRRVHTGERPYICTNCGKRFTLKSNLKRHQRIHTGDRVFSFK